MRNIIFLGLLFVFFCSCIKSERKQNLFDIQTIEIIDDSDINNDNVILKLSKNIDSISIEFWYTPTAETYYFNVSSDKDLNIKKGLGDKIINLKTETIKNKNCLVGYINKLYIDKTEKIIITRKKRGWIKSADYPVIYVRGYNAEREIFETKNRVGDDVYDIEYSIVFLEFYNFLIEILNIEN